MKQEQEPERLGGCCQQSLTTHLYGESFFLLGFFWCSQPHPSHAGLSEGVTFDLPPQGALQSSQNTPCCPMLSCPVLALCPCPPSGPSMSPGWAKPGPRPHMSPELPWTPEHFPWLKDLLATRPPMQLHPGHPSCCPSILLHPGAGWQLKVAPCAGMGETAGQAAVWGGDLEGAEAMPCTARVPQGCTFTHWQSLAESRKGKSWVLWSRGRLPPWGTATAWHWYDQK